jgi:drug/metabolite transporter (DMT)-like permease
MKQTKMSPPDHGFSFTRLMPPLFVLLWSTGFIGAKFGLPYAEPFTFLLIRMLLVSSLLAAVALAWRARWPRSPALIAHVALAGVLVHGFYLGGVFVAISWGLSAGVTALVVGLQPLLTAALAGPLLGEKVTRGQWLGLAVGLVGVVLVVSSKLAVGLGALSGLVPAFVSLLAITYGTLHQKRYCGGMDLRSGAAVQYAAAAVLYAFAAFAFEEMTVQWTGEFVFALAWLTLVLSVGAIFLLFAMIRAGAASKVAGLFYLTPPTTALIAWALFGETMSPAALVGMGLTAVGVWQVNRSSA